ncbi:MAG: hypothetical protein [Caudoviricetes sp.]|nr:MAG: hypothetical protein [Caudoviricetes sp.]
MENKEDFKSILKRLNELEKYKEKKEKEERRAKEKEKDNKIKELESEMAKLQQNNYYYEQMYNLYKSLYDHNNVLSVSCPTLYRI